MTQETTTIAGPAQALGTDAPVSADLREQARLDDEDRKLLVCTAAYQLRYGEVGEALALLVLCRKYWPQDYSVLKTLIATLVKTKEDEAAAAIFEEVKAHYRHERWSADLLLMHCIMLYRQTDFRAAKTMFISYLKKWTAGRKN